SPTLLMSPSSSLMLTNALGSNTKAIFPEKRATAASSNLAILISVLLIGRLKCIDFANESISAEYNLYPFKPIFSFPRYLITSALEAHVFVINMLFGVQKQ